MFEAQGLKFFITVEEPDTIVYNYQYTNSDSFHFNANNQEGLSSFTKFFRNSVAPSVKTDIAQYKKVYKLPVRVIRMVYLNPDGDTLILIYRSATQRAVADYTQEELEASFASSFGANAKTLRDNLETMLGFKIGSMRLQVKNADGTLICDIPLDAILDAQ